MQSSRQKAAGDAGATWEDYDRNDAVQDQESRLSPGRERQVQVPGGVGGICWEKGSGRHLLQTGVLVLTSDVEFSQFASTNRCLLELLT